LALEYDRLAGGTIPADVVLGPSPTTRTLASLMVQRPVSRALDIGTGCGALALLASRFADEVVATDVNPRALAYTSRNAAANGITNVRCMQGSLVEAVADQRFDLIVGNLPFVVSPATSLTFRDGVRPTSPGPTNPGPTNPGSPKPASGICEAAIADSAAILAGGGVAQFLVNWMVTDPERPYDTPVSWVRSTGCGGLVLLHSLQSPERYVDVWAKSADDDRHRWLAHLAERNAVAIANGAVVVHRPIHKEYRPTVRAARMSPPHGRGGDQIERILGTGSPSDLDIVSGRLRLVPSTIAEERHPDGRRLARIRADDSCGVTAAVPLEQLALLELLDVRRRLDDAVGAWTQGAGDRTAESLAERTAAATATARHLVAHGLMELDTG